MGKWWNKYGAWVFLVVILVLVCLRVLYIPPLPEKYMWTEGVFLLVVFGLIAYFSYRKPKD